MARDFQQLDTSIEIVTPENIAFRYYVAGPFRRLPAYLFDLFIRLAAAGAALMGFGLFFGLIGLEGIGGMLALILWFLFAFFYGGVFEAYWNGQTPGKRLMGIRVLTIDGQPINGLQAVLRNILRGADMLPPGFYQLGLLAAASNRRFQRIGDLVCGTMVVVEQRAWLAGVARFSEPQVVQLAASLPPGFLPSRTLIRALAAYVRRRQNFSWSRRVEIARHLADPLRQQFGLPANTNPDLLLSALYHRTFAADREEDDAPRSPFGRAVKPAAPALPMLSAETIRESTSF